MMITDQWVRLYVILLCLVAIGACGQQEDGQREETTETGPNVVEIKAEGLTFEAPSDIPAGWTRFRLVNESTMSHFALVARYPEGVGVEEHQELVAPVFQEGMDLLAKGQTDSAMAAFKKLPTWFGEITFLGGPGMTGPERTSEATVNLEPGTYVIECYVKTNGIFHSYNPDPETYGMVAELTVTESEDRGQPPASDAEISISSKEGIVADSLLNPGEYTFAVRFEDQSQYGNFVGHDVHLVRLGDASLEEIEAWMDWTRPGGLNTPAPADFVGGTNEMPAGETSYFTADLEPGRYAWIAEVPSPGEKNMVKLLTVES